MNRPIVQISCILILQILNNFSYHLLNKNTGNNSLNDIIKQDQFSVQNFEKNSIFYSHFNVILNQEIVYPSLFRNKYLFSLTNLYKKISIFNFQHSNFFNFFSSLKKKIIIKYLYNLTHYLNYKGDLYIAI